VENTVITVLIVALGSFLAFLGFRMSKMAKEEADFSPIKNRAADTARSTIQQTFEEEVNEIWKDVEGDDPAGDLADRGNARKRK
jgi:mannose-6-phosphate isomerase class I